MIKSDYRALLENLSEKANKYSIIVNNTDDEYVYTTSLQNLERISGAPSYLFLMYLLTNQESLCLSDSDIRPCLKNKSCTTERNHVS